MSHEWDWPPRRRRYYRTINTFEIYQPNDWDWPIRKKIIDIGWRVMVACIKAMLMTALTILAFCAAWFTATVIKLY